MPAIEASTTVYLYTAEPSMTALASRVTQRREEAIPGTEEQIRFLDFVSRDEWRRQIKPRDIQTAQTEEQGVATANTRAGAISVWASPLPEEPKTQADRTVSQLIQFQHLHADWDGNEAAKPLPFSLRDARKFVRALAPESIIPRPALHADGHAILFFRGPDVYAELEFLGNKRISFYARRGGRQWSDEFDFDGRTLPEGLLQIGFAV
jgi:hypothetical protein